MRQIAREWGGAMDLLEKIRILGAGAKYDASCSSSGSTRASALRGIGNAAQSGICHSWSDDGRCISLLKILLTNYCIYDCAYCANRLSNDIERAAFTVDEIVDLTMNFYRRNYIEGLFLSSGVMKSPDQTMEMMLRVVKKLRLDREFHGYIHLKAIPGASEHLVHEAGLYADRMSVNIELPSAKSLQLLAPQKDSRVIFHSMTDIGAQISENSEKRKSTKKALPLFVPAGQSTQVIIGASPETDLSIIRMSENLYNKVRLKRVYYSAFIPVNDDRRLPALNTPPLVRENRLYQDDWLLRLYGFEADEILDPDKPFLDLEFDPKTAWALRNMKYFPVEANRADYETLLRVPGIGVRSAKRIVQSRRFSVLRFDHLKNMGVVLKRARYFLTCAGKFLEDFDRSEDAVRERMLRETAGRRRVNSDELFLFPSGHGAAPQTPASDTGYPEFEKAPLQIPVQSRNMKNTAPTMQSAAHR